MELPRGPRPAGSPRGNQLRVQQPAIAGRSADNRSTREHPVNWEPAAHAGIPAAGPHPPAHVRPTATQPHSGDGSRPPTQSRPWRLPRRPHPTGSRRVAAAPPAPSNRFLTRQPVACPAASDRRLLGPQPVNARTPGQMRARGSRWRPAAGPSPAYVRPGATNPTRAMEANRGPSPARGGCPAGAIQPVPRAATSRVPSNQRSPAARPTTGQRANTRSNESPGLRLAPAAGPSPAHVRPRCHTTPLTRWKPTADPVPPAGAAPAAPSNRFPAWGGCRAGAIQPVPRAATSCVPSNQRSPAARPTTGQRANTRSNESPRLTLAPAGAIQSVPVVGRLPRGRHPTGSPRGNQLRAQQPAITGRSAHNRPTREHPVK